MTTPRRTASPAAPAPLALVSMGNLSLPPSPLASERKPAYDDDLKFRTKLLNPVQQPGHMSRKLESLHSEALVPFAYLSLPSLLSPPPPPSLPSTNLVAPKQAPATTRSPRVRPPLPLLATTLKASLSPPAVTTVTARPTATAVVAEDVADAEDRSASLIARAPPTGN